MQPALFHESIEDALREVINTCGGAKVVAGKLWTDKTPEAAHRLLLACLNEDRPERFSPGHVLLLLRMGRERGCHAGMDYIARDTGYQAAPIEPEDERAMLQRAFIESTKAQAQIVERLERLEGSARLRAA